LSIDEDMESFTHNLFDSFDQIKYAYDPLIFTEAIRDWFGSNMLHWYKEHNE